jgi:hypothetical protein
VHFPTFHSTEAQTHHRQCLARRVNIKQHTGGHSLRLHFRKRCEIVHPCSLPTAFDSFSTMADNIEPNADLASILATLASLQQPGIATVQTQEQGYDPNQTYQGYQEDAQAYPTQHNLPYHQIADPRLQNRSTSQHLPTPPRPQEKVSTPLIDPATITEWKQGLRCVSKIAQQNPDFAASVRKVHMKSLTCCSRKLMGG